MILTSLTCFVRLPWWSLWLGCSKEKNCPTDPSINGQSDRPLVLQCWRTIIDREQLFPQALLWHHQWNAAEWRDIKIMRQGWAGQTSMWGHTCYTSLYLYYTSMCYECPSLGKSLFDPLRFHTFPEFGSNTLLTIFLFFYFIFAMKCNKCATSKENST